MQNEWVFVGKRFHIDPGNGRTLCGKWGFVIGSEKVELKRIEARGIDCKGCVKLYNDMFPKEEAKA